MVELGLNVLIVGGMAAPLFLLARLKRQSAWVDKRHGELSIPTMGNLHRCTLCVRLAQAAHGTEPAIL
jgi:hypothetical protein